MKFNFENIKNTFNQFNIYQKIAGVVLAVAIPASIGLGVSSVSANANIDQSSSISQFLSSIPVISSMGTGNKLDPTMFEVADIYETSVCPLARIMKKDFRKRNIEKLKVVYSKEQPINTNDCAINQHDKKYKVKGSVSFVPSVAGLIIAGEVIKDIISD